MRLVARTMVALVALVALLAAAPRAAAGDSIYQVAVTPDYVEVAGGTAIRFQAALFRKHERKFLRQEWEWRCDGGTFEAGGETWFAENTWTAPHRPGTYRIRVTQERPRRHGVFGVATVVVVPPAPRPVPIVCRHVVRLNATEVTLRPGEVFRFTTTSCGCHVAGSLVWRCAGGRIEDGLFTAGPRPGNYVLEVLDPALHAAATCTIRIVAPPPLAVRVDLSPARAEILPGAFVELEPRAFDPEGREIPPAFLVWDWSCEGGGTVDLDGVVRAPASAPARLIVRARERRSGLLAEAEIRVRAACRSVAIAAPRFECAPGERIRLTATGYDDGGRPLAGCDFDWRLTGWPAGVNDPRAVVQDGAGGPGLAACVLPDGTFQADGPAGAYTIAARERSSGVEATAVMTIRAAVRLVNIAPRVLVLRPGARHRFTVQGYDAYNRPVDAVVQFSAEAGQVGPDGWFTAPWEAGRHVKVKAVDPRTGASDWADVYVGW